MLETYNPNIEYYSFAYATSIPLFYRFIESAKEETQNKINFFKTIDLDVMKKLIDFINLNQIYIYFLYDNVINTLRLIDDLFNVNLFDTLFGQWGYEYEGELTYEEIKDILDCFSYDFKENKFVIFHDFLVDNKSSLGMGFDDGINYNGFNRYIKLLDDKNSAKVRAVINEPEVGHNLEAYDEDTIDFIVSNLDFGSGIIHNIDYYKCFKTIDYYRLF